MHEIKGWHTRGYLPHYDCEKLYQFVTFRLYDSVPSDVIIKLKDELSITNETDYKSEYYIELQRRIIEFEDNGYGACYLQIEAIADLVENALKFYDGKKYNLIEWVIMPNHVHVLIEVFENYSLSSIVHSWKSYTASQANKILQRKGKFWMKEYYDRYIRDEIHLARVIKYIQDNPKKKV
ncbi:MAG: transposase [Candidatus Cloacimonadales bacterium]